MVYIKFDEDIPATHIFAVDIPFTYNIIDVYLVGIDDTSITVMIQDETYNWLNENFQKEDMGKDWFVKDMITKARFLFKEQENAVRFKITWGGAKDGSL